MVTKLIHGEEITRNDGTYEDIAYFFLQQTTMEVVTILNSCLYKRNFSVLWMKT
jgi:hypothetical protein